ncbi:Scr1 family TA system antitoxin-like transcriptional regulator [Lentzea nigeriaca]|uniref:Scr1 family TA system antitoxin-like transcriptional regulator n=1 Tax=Lentzea nigeriaca TaxID=1128665 RepID=UPI0035583907
MASCPVVGFPFAGLSFPHRQHDDVAYVGTFLTSGYIEDQHNRERCVQRFAALQQMALSPANSLELIAEAASNLWPAA